MRLLFLGTVSAVPTIERNVSALALQFSQRSQWWLFDCGEGTQHQILRTSLTLPKLSHIFISHLHGDHCFGLMGLLASRGLQTAQEPISLYGPKGLRDFVRAIQKTTGLYLSYPLAIKEVGSEIILTDAEYEVRAVEVVHIGKTLAFVITEKPRIGRFRVEEAQKLGIPAGPLYGRLKDGHTIRLDDGRVIDGKQLVDPPRKGRKLVIVSDTCDASRIVGFAANAQLMVHEATYLGKSDAQLAKQRGHATAASAGKLAKQANVENLVLTHFSPRYDNKKGNAAEIAELVKEAENEFIKGKVTAAKDFMTIDVPRL